MPRETLPIPMPALIAKPGHTAPPRVTVGLLTWNPDADLKHVLAAIFAQDEPAFELLWVDNGSPPEALAGLREQFPQLPEPALNPRNMGFCAGHNQLIRAARAPYYLALNQDASPGPDYLRRLADWFDAEPKLALASGVVLQAATPPRIQSAGLAYPRNRASFLVGLDEPLSVLSRTRRIASGVAGPAMMLRIETCRTVSDPPDEIFPEDFFAYHEELDLAQRLGRAGFVCGVDERIQAMHGLHSSGGRRQFAIQVKFLANLWLLNVRHDSLGLLVREFPWLVWGELRWRSYHYRGAPLALIPAFFEFLRRLPAARRFYRAFERRHGPTQARLIELRRLAGRELQMFQHKQDARTSKP